MDLIIHLFLYKKNHGLLSLTKTPHGLKFGDQIIYNLRKNKCKWVILQGAWSIVPYDWSNIIDAIKIEWDWKTPRRIFEAIIPKKGAAALCLLSQDYQQTHHHNWHLD